MTPLEEYLESAVRLEVATLTKEGWQCEDYHIEEAQRRMQALRDKGSGEALQYYDCKRTSEERHILLYALAAMAFRKGGVNFGRLHFEVNRECPMDCVSYERYGARAGKIDE